MEAMPFSAAGLIRVTGRIWLENALWILPLSVLAAAPVVAVRWLVPTGKWWVETLCTLTTAALVECWLLLVLARRTFAWTKTPLPKVLRDAYLTVLLVNVVSNLVAMIGLLLCFVGMLFFANFLNLAVPLALFDRRGVRGSLAESLSLSKAQYWRLFPATAVFGAPVLDLTGVLARALPAYVYPLEAIHLAAPVIERMLYTPPQVLELAVWYFLVARAREAPVLASAPRPLQSPMAQGAPTPEG
jgi:hypothetical protein